MARGERDEVHLVCILDLCIDPVLLAESIVVDRLDAFIHANGPSSTGLSAVCVGVARSEVFEGSLVCGGLLIRANGERESVDGGQMIGVDRKDL